ncbi:guanine nucleotide binding protein, alpha subunit [Mucidula mucida]|nr:guanine nucleotide binding protein, alpha subunit [Mucidula mucida]
MDPLDEALKPPPDETEAERRVRLEREEKARAVSLAIDDSIKAERQATKRKRIVRLLLLGQSESGKSTTLRQFQRLYTPTAFREERVLWRAVIQLNVVRSIRVILDALERPGSPGVSPVRAGMVHSDSHSQTHSKRRIANAHGNGNLDPNDDWAYAGFASQSQSGGESDVEVDVDSEYSAPRQHHHRHPSHTQNQNHAHIDALRLRLLPLRHIEALLIAKLVPHEEDDATSHDDDERRGKRAGEIFVRPGVGWRGALARARVFGAGEGIDYEGLGVGRDRQRSIGSEGSGDGVSSFGNDTDVDEALYNCREDMMALWHDPVVRAVLRRKKVRLEEVPGFFLDDLERITRLKYLPTDDDVLKARLKTVGVSEYKFEMEVSAGREAATEWRIVDVGGSRSQTWMPFFDDVDAIIFLAPISGFDQVLTEDRSVNRLEDSVLLWKALCSNKLLAKVDLVLFLNKCDILGAKLRAGVKLAKYVRSYGDKSNDVDSVSKYLRSKFNAIHREYSPLPRKFYAFTTSVTDTGTTAGIIASVRDMVIRQHLKQSKLL